MRITLAMLAVVVAGATIVAVAYKKMESRLTTGEARWTGAMERLQKGNEGDRLAAAELLARLAFEQDPGASDRSPSWVRALPADLASIAEIVGRKTEGAAVRLALVRVLGSPRLRDRAFVTLPRLADRIRDESDDPSVRAAILSGLASIGPRQAFQGAVLEAVASPSASVRAAAFRVLDMMEIRPETLVPILDRGLSDPEDAVRLAAIELAGDLAEKDVPGTFDLLLRGFQSPRRPVRRLALVRLRALGAKAARAVPEVSRALRSTSDPVFRLELAAALADLTGDADAYLPYMIAGLRSKDFPIWHPATTALIYAWRRGPGADARLPALQAVLDDDQADPDARARAAVALAVITKRPKSYETWIDRGSASKDRLSRAWVERWGRTALRGPLQRPALPSKTQGITPLGAATAVACVAVFIWFDMKRFLRRAERDQRAVPFPKELLPDLPDRDEPTPAS
jgi:HEAT repeat protein